MERKKEAMHLDRLGYIRGLELRDMEYEINFLLLNVSTDGEVRAMADNTANSFQNGCQT